MASQGSVCGKRGNGRAKMTPLTERAASCVSLFVCVCKTWAVWVSPSLAFKLLKGSILSAYCIIIQSLSN